MLTLKAEECNLLKESPIARDQSMRPLKTLYAEHGAMKNHLDGGISINPISLTIGLPITVRVALTPMKPTLMNLHQLHKNEEEKLLIDSILLALKETSIKLDLSKGFCKTVLEIKH